MKHEFSWYLHGDNLGEESEEFAEANPDLPPEVVDHLIENNPFYEVTVYGHYDDKTGKIELTHVS